MSAFYTLKFCPLSQVPSGNEFLEYENWFGIKRQCSTKRGGGGGRLFVQVGSLSKTWNLDKTKVQRTSKKYSL